MEIGASEIDSSSVYFIAEAGSNHNGDFEVARELATIAAEAGADAVKFQTFEPEKLVSPDSEQLDEIDQLTLSHEEFRSLKDHTDELGITLLSTPFDEDSATFLDELGVDAIKISSGDITNYPLLEHVATFGRPLIVSSGMATREEIAAAEKRIRSVAPDLDVAFLHCVSDYPTDIADLNLNMISDIDELVDGPVGFSDHSIEVETPGIAVGAGATIVEKHFGISRRLPVPDAAVSLEPDELERAVSIAKNAAAAKGESKKRPVDAERENIDAFRKSVHAITEIPPDSVIESGDVALLRPGDGLSPDQLETVIGSEAASHLEPGDTVTDADIK
ncbi:N-acetylneuraminate synthase family protein [Halorientalis pallida]|uniref:N-acetylneuraminate synthase family protein n=1 Tax=Halorientalis pallida TaxID=2479928 RepID=UPI003C6F8508